MDVHTESKQQIQDEQRLLAALLLSCAQVLRGVTMRGFRAGDVQDMEQRRHADRSGAHLKRLMRSQR